MHQDTLLNVFLAIAVDNLANAQELTAAEEQAAEQREKVSSYSSFFPRDAMLTRYMLSSCVCLSVCHMRCCVKTAKLRIKQTTPHDIPGL